MAVARRLRRWLDNAEQAITSLLLIGILGLVFLSVILRYFFASGVVWGEEIVRVAFIGMTYMAISRVDLHGVHFRVTLIEDLFPASRRYLALAVAVIEMGLLLLLTWLAGSIGLFIRQMGQQLPASGVAAWLFYIPVVVGLSLATLRAAGRVVVSVGKLIERPNETGAPPS